MTPQIAEVYGRASVNMHPLGVTGRYVTLNLHDNILCVLMVNLHRTDIRVSGFTDARP
jgi:hypothetical protein